MAAEEKDARPPYPQPPALPVRTERLVLRQLTPDDVDDLHAYHGREEVCRYLLHDPWTREEAAGHLARWLRIDDGDLEAGLGGVGFGVELDGRIVGDLVLMFREPAYRQAELGWVMNPEVGERGIATEAMRAVLAIAFDHYGFHRVYADLDARNDPSRRLCERLGMRREMHALQDYWVKGEWTDSYRYALLAEEYAAARDSAVPGDVPRDVAR